MLITNPRCVETGLDLNAFTTIIFYSMGYNLFTLRQASRRSWRINQTAPRVEVYMLYYADMETSILSAYSKNECQKYFDYLEQLRQSGETNMYGAASYLQEEFPELRYAPERAKEILLAWFGTFEKGENEKC